MNKNILLCIKYPVVNFKLTILDFVNLVLNANIIQLNKNHNLNKKSF